MKARIRHSILYRIEYDVSLMALVRHEPIDRCLQYELSFDLLSEKASGGSIVSTPSLHLCDEGANVLGLYPNIRAISQ